MDFARNFRLLRKKANLSQENIAEQLHISRQAVSKWEQGQSTPDIETCVKLCQVLNVTPTQLLSGTEDSQETTQKFQKPHTSTIFIFSSIFLMLVCFCGTIMLICNLYNGKVFEPTIHLLSLIMICGALSAFLAMVMFKIISANRHKEKA